MNIADLPVIYNPYVPRGTVYVLNGNLMIIGTWAIDYKSVAEIITDQRRRRRGHR